MNSPIAPARRAAFDLLLELKRKPELHSDALLHGKRLQALSSVDKNLATTLVMGVLRWQLVLQERMRASLTRSKSHLGDPVQTAIELGALQLLALDRIPAHAAIFESVELVRQSGDTYAVGLVNAVLRKLSQSPRLVAADAMSAHPDWMVARWVAAYGQQATAGVCVYDQTPPPTTIRLPAAEAANGMQLDPGFFVERARRMVGGDVSASRVAYRIQDEGSQLIAELAGRGTNILDCCAAPGGKTAILAERNPTAQITACDVSPRRLKAMQAMLGNPNIRFRVLDATELPYQQHFDLILCDAPCSGTGTMARNPEIRHRVSVQEFVRQHARQVRLLGSAMGALRPGGRLIYSTCSLEAEENEDVIAEAMEGKEFQLLPWRAQIGRLENEGVLRPGTADRLFPDGAADDFIRILPGACPGDGFFAACITRT